MSKLEVTAEGSSDFVEALVADLRGGKPVADERFDGLFQPRWRALSTVHWSPVEVCRRAAALLSRGADSRVLDVGSGPGKLCLVGALIGAGEFVGVEKRAALVGEAKTVATRLGATRARFMLGDAFDLDWSGYDGLYFYNPFGELEPSPYQGVDAEISRDEAELEQRRLEIGERLRRLPDGTRVVSFHGVGCPMPSTYSLLRSEEFDNGPLELWVQTANVFTRRAGGELA